MGNMNCERKEQMGNSEEKKKIIGIDLGTTNSCVAVVENGMPTVIQNAEGLRTTPSVVAFTNKGERIVGDNAKRQAVINPSNTFMSVKRHIGSDWKAEVFGKEYNAQQISAMILQKLKAEAERYLETEITDAVITVPAYFDDAQRQATKDAGKIAKLRVSRIINEPTAAALAYGLDNYEEQKIMVYDLGGGTFDVSVIGIGDGIIEVLSTNGDTNLGGDDFDAVIADWIISTCREKTGVDLTEDRSMMQLVKEEAEKAKRMLSSVTQVNINIPFVATSGRAHIHFDEMLTREEFEKMVKPLIDKSAKPVLNALADAGLSPKDLDKVLLVGGSTRMPCIQEKVYELVGIKPSCRLNPDECVALGAAVQGGKMSDENDDFNDMLLLDVTPLSLSIETLGGVSTVLIERNTTIPTRKTQVFSTSEDNQTSVEIHVLQGERQFARDNKLLGNFILDGIPEAEKGVPQIAVTFDIDANGIIKVSAMDMNTGREQNIIIEASKNMSMDDINDAINEAQEHNTEDIDKRKKIDTFNECEAFVLQAERNMGEMEDTAEKQDMENIRIRISKLKEYLKNSPDSIDDYSLDQMNRLKEDILSRIRSISEAAFHPGLS